MATTLPLYVAGDSGGGKFLARLTDRQFNNGQFTKYAWTKITDSDAPTPLTYTDTTTTGTFVTNPAYHIRGCGTDLHELDILTVPVVVYLTKGTGSYYLIDASESTQFVQKTAAIDANGYFPGQRLRYDPTLVGNTPSNRFVAVVGDNAGDARLILMIDANTP